jgi:hypothetical protein
VAATVRRPVWCGQRRSGGLPAAGSAKRTPPRCADSRDRRRDRVGRRSPPTGQAVIVALRRAQRPVWAPGVRISRNFLILRSRSRTSSKFDRALRRSSIAHRSPGLRGAASCPAPATIAEQLHAQHGWVQAGPCQASVGVVGRSVGEAAVALATVAGCQPSEGGVTAATGDTHRSSPATPSGQPSPHRAVSRPR